MQMNIADKMKRADSLRDELSALDAELKEKISNRIRELMDMRELATVGDRGPNSTFFHRLATLEARGVIAIFDKDSK